MKGKIAIKSVLLIILILLSILQIEKLWFEDYSNHSFFRLFAQKNNPEAAFQELIFEPEYIAVYSAGELGEYRQLDSESILFQAIHKDTGKFMRQLPQMGRIERYQYAQLYNRPHILCSFPSGISKNLLLKLAQKPQDEKDSEIINMAVLPADLEESHFGILFFDENAELSVGFSIAKTVVTDENEVFYQFIKNSGNIGDTLLYSAKQQELSAFAGEVLLPSQKQDYILPREWKREFSFLQQEQTKIDTESLKDYLFPYSKNPKILWNIEEENRVRYGDSSVMMEYNLDGLFQYRYIQALAAGKKDIPAGEALKVVDDFMGKDVRLAMQETKLADYRYQDGRHYFYYQYYFRGHPLIWGEDTAEKYQMPYPMEFVVEKDMVVSYRRVLLEADLLQQGTRFRVNYQDALNLFYQGNEQEKIVRLDLAYYFDKGKMKLGWLVETKEKQLIYPLKVEEANELE